MKSISLVFASLAIATSSHSAILSTYQLTHQNKTREYHVFAPTGTKAPLPVVFSFHGGGGSGRGMDDIIQLTPIAQREGFLVVFPEGIDKNFNDGRPERNPDIDDVGFFDAILKELPKKHPIQGNQVFVTGMSNGGLMSFRLVCERSDVIAGAAPVIATMGEKLSTHCKPGKRVAILNILGNSDPLMPFGGGSITGPLGFRKLGKVLSSDATVKFWTTHLGCSSTPQVTRLDANADDKTSSRRENYPGCANGSAFERIVVMNGGHNWPGGKQYLRERLIGKTSRDFNAGEVIWEFFKGRTS